MTTSGDGNGVDDRFRSDLSDMIKVRGRIMTAIILDCALLVLWLAVLWAFDYLVKLFGNPADFSWVVAYYVFGGSTVITILIFLFWDIRQINRRLRDHYNARTRPVDSPRAGMARGQAAPGVHGGPDGPPVEPLGSVEPGGQ